MLVLRGDAGRHRRARRRTLPRRGRRRTGRALDRAADRQRADGSSARHRPRGRPRPRTGAAWRSSLVRMPGALEGDIVRGIVFHGAALEAARKLPGAEAAGWVSVLPVGRSTSQLFTIETGRAGLVERAEAEVNVASAGYFTDAAHPDHRGTRASPPPTARSSKPVVDHQRPDGAALFRIGSRRPSASATRKGPSSRWSASSAPGNTGRCRRRPSRWSISPCRSAIRNTCTCWCGPPDRRSRCSPRCRGVWPRSIPGSRSAATVTFDGHLAEALTLDRILTTVVAACGLRGVAARDDRRLRRGRRRRAAADAGDRAAGGARRAELADSAAGVQRGPAADGGRLGRRASSRRWCCRGCSGRSSTPSLASTSPAWQSSRSRCCSSSSAPRRCRRGGRCASARRSRSRADG